MVAKVMNVLDERFYPLTRLDLTYLDALSLFSRDFVSNQGFVQDVNKWAVARQKYSMRRFIPGLMLRRDVQSN